MTLLLIVAAWLISVSLVAGLCMAARAGDREPLARPLADADQQGASTLVWEQADGVGIYARANVGRTHTAESGVAVLHGDGIAA
ncbi:MAG TPA: hypothetical protein VIH92_07500 [Solirubrobacteraceae bacterium]|jgi:hypothetical protein